MKMQVIKSVLFVSFVLLSLSIVSAGPIADFFKDLIGGKPRLSPGPWCNGADLDQSSAVDAEDLSAVRTFFGSNCTEIFDNIIKDSCLISFPNGIDSTALSAVRENFGQTGCSGPSASTCGNDIIEPGEVCERDDNITFCVESEYESIAWCDFNCRGYGNCILTEFCGDGILNGLESCDDGFQNGQFGFCNENCTWIGQSNETALCGNNETEIGEQCDGMDLQNETCASLGFEGGLLGCFTAGRPDECTFSTVGCTTGSAICGNDILDSNESCDGSALAGETCQTFGYQEGSLSCCSNCTNFDLSACKNVTRTCVDNDGGLPLNQTIFIPSNITFSKLTIQGPNCEGSSGGGAGSFISNDYCLPNGVLVEKICNIFGNESLSKNFTCPNGYSCIDGACRTALDNCQLTDALWSTTNATEGEFVNLSVIGTNCTGKTINFEIFEKDFIGDDPVNINPSSTIFIEGIATTSWISEYQPDGFGGDPEYYFIASLNEDPSVSIESPNWLFVSQSSGGEICTESCATILKVISIVNSTSGFNNDRVILENIKTGNRYDAAITAEGEAVISIGGDSYTLTYRKDNYELEGYIIIDSIPKQKVYKNSHVVLGASKVDQVCTKSCKTVLKVISIANSTSGFNNDRILLEDIKTGNRYDAAITAEGEAVISIGGVSYTLTYVKNNINELDGYITMERQKVAKSAHIIL